MVCGVLRVNSLAICFCLVYVIFVVGGYLVGCLSCCVMFVDLFRCFGLLVYLLCLGLFAIDFPFSFTLTCLLVCCLILLGLFCVCCFVGLCFRLLVVCLLCVWVYCTGMAWLIGLVVVGWGFGED